MHKCILSVKPHVSCFGLLGEFARLIIRYNQSVPGNGLAATENAVLQATITGSDQHTRALAGHVKIAEAVFHAVSEITRKNPHRLRSAEGEDAAVKNLRQPTESEVAHCYRRHDVVCLELPQVKHLIYKSINGPDTEANKSADGKYFLMRLLLELQELVNQGAVCILSGTHV